MQQQLLLTHCVCVCVRARVYVYACACVSVFVLCVHAPVQLHTIGGNWGSASGTGGQIGSDDVCVSGCTWTKESGLKYDYAIFVK